jgi:hypothetical protein
MWKLFAEKEHEQLLIPFGIALARSYTADGRKSDAIRLLQNIRDQEESFSLEQDTWSGHPTTLLPVKMLLGQLNPDDSHLPTTAKQFQEVPIAKICPGEIEWNVPRSQLSEFQRTQLLTNGILFEKGFMMIKFSSMMPELESEPPTPLPTIYHLHATSDRAAKWRRRRNEAVEAVRTYCESVSLGL